MWGGAAPINNNATGSKQIEMHNRSWHIKPAGWVRGQIDSMLASGGGIKSNTTFVKL